MSWKLKALDEEKVPDSAKVKQAVSKNLIFKENILDKKEWEQPNFLVKFKSLSPQGEDHGNESRGEGGCRKCWGRGGLILNFLSRNSGEIFMKYKFVFKR